MPPPNRNLIHYYGALVPRSPLRPAVVAKVEKEAALLAGQKKADKLKKKVNSWAACLARIFEVYPLICPKCNLEMKPVVVILNDKAMPVPYQELCSSNGQRTCAALNPPGPAR